MANLPLDVTLRTSAPPTPGDVPARKRQAEPLFGSVLQRMLSTGRAHAPPLRRNEDAPTRPLVDEKSTSHDQGANKDAVAGPQNNGPNGRPNGTDGAPRNAGAASTESSTSKHAYASDDSTTDSADVERADVERADASVIDEKDEKNAVHEEVAAAADDGVQPGRPVVVTADAGQSTEQPGATVQPTTAISEWEGEAASRLRPHSAGANQGSTERVPSEPTPDATDASRQAPAKQEGWVTTDTSSAPADESSAATVVGLADDEAADSASARNRTSANGTAKPTADQEPKPQEGGAAPDGDPSAADTVAETAEAVDELVGADEPTDESSRAVEARRQGQAAAKTSTGAGATHSGGAVVNPTAAVASDNGLRDQTELKVDAALSVERSDDPSPSRQPSDRGPNWPERVAASRSLQPTARIDQPPELTTVERARLVQRVSGALQRAHLQDGAMRVRLSPPELGSLRIDLAVRHGVLTATIEADTTQARNVLLDNLPALRDRLAEQEIRVERFDVEVRRDGQQQPQDPGERRGRANQQPLDNPPVASRDSGVSESTTSPATGPSIGDQALDVRV